MNLFGQTKKWSINQIINLVNNNSFFFDENENWKIDIELFLCSILKCKKTDLYLNSEKVLNKSQLSELMNYIDRRKSNEPVQYIIQSSNFYGRNFFIDQNVFIPRPETERLIDITKEKTKNLKSPIIFDIGTGSGCISITLAIEIPDAQVLANDISKDAIDVARKNMNTYFVKNLQLINEDVFLNLGCNSLDILISNPPYIKLDEYFLLMPDVINFEPKAALTDRSNGLSFYKRIAELGNLKLNKGGWIILEVGKGKHPLEVREIFNNYDYDNIELFKDYNGDYRVIVAQN